MTNYKFINGCYSVKVKANNINEAILKAKEKIINYTSKNKKKTTIPMLKWEKSTWFKACFINDKE